MFHFVLTDETKLSGFYGCQGSPKLVIVEFFVIGVRHFDVDIDAIQHRAGDAFLVAGDGLYRADAIFGGVLIKDTRAGN